MVVVVNLVTLSLKYYLKGISERIVLHANLDLISKCVGTHGALVKSAERFDINVNAPEGQRRSKNALRKLIDGRLQACVHMPTVPKKRK